MDPARIKYLEKAFDKTHDIKFHNEGNLDKTTLILSSGSLILSINFLNSLTNSSEIKNLVILKISWIALLTSLILILLGYMFAIYSGSETMERINSAIENNTNFDYRKNIWQKLISACSFIAPFMLIVGLILMAIFTLKNI